MMKKSIPLLFGSLLAGLLLLANSASAYVGKYEGYYVLDRGCSVTVWAHAGFAVLGTDDDGESIQETYSSEPINLSCDDVRSHFNTAAII